VSIDPAVFHLPDKAPDRRIVYMPRKRSADSRMVLNILRSRGSLQGWDIVPIDKMPQSAVAHTLRSAPLFLSFCYHEGCPLPPLEALASGCCVIGYTGFGAQEYFGPPHAIPVPEGDVSAFAHEVETWVQNFDADEQWLAAQRGSEKALASYRPEQEEAGVVSFWRNVLSEMPKSQGVTCTVKRHDVVEGSLRGIFRKSASDLRDGMREMATEAASTVRVWKSRA
jgi:glycosyltransferase involved in cell wall biosynthesis